MKTEHDKENKLNKAFAFAIKSQNNKSSSDDKLNLNDGVSKAFPQIFDNDKSLDKKNYTDTIFNRYKIIKQIGSGGMGSVYLAKRIDGEFDKNVAIKLLTAGFNDSRIKQRFLREKQILAQLRHPNIIPLLDAGQTDDGIPWFVLEYIKGDCIDEFCKNNELSIEAKVNLAIKICDAIAFAHSKGIIHRDIKPANILIENIDGQYNPVVLDFGIAHKSDQKHLTNQGNIIGTPGYMSPEQIKAKDHIDRRSDIFSLGVVMYQIMSGVKPFKGKNIVDIHKKILEHEPQRLNKVIPSFPKNLQIIIETCLAKEAQYRYQSVAELKQDLCNWLKGFPINAKKEAFYKTLMRKAKRNKAVSLLSLALLALTFGSVIKYTYDINQERRIALKASAESEDLFNFLFTDLQKKLIEIGRVDLLQSVAEKNLQHLNNYNLNKNNQNSFKYITSYRNIAKVLEMQQDISLSIDASKKAIDLLQNIKGTTSSDKKNEMLVLTYADLIAFNTKLGDLKQADNYYQSALEPLDLLYKNKSENTALSHWQLNNAYAWNLLEKTDYEKASQLIQKNLKIAKEYNEKYPNNSKWMSHLYRTLTVKGWYELDNSDYQKASIDYSHALEIAQKLYQRTPNSVPMLSNLQKTNNQLAYTYYLSEVYDKAINRTIEAINFGKILHDRAPQNNAFFRELAYSYTMLGDSYLKNNQTQLAEDSYKQSLAISKNIAQSSPENTSLQNDLAIDLLKFADILDNKGQKSEAKQYLHEAEKVIRPIATKKDASIYYIVTYVQTLLFQNKTDLALPYLMKMKNSKGWAHDAYYQLLEDFDLSDTDN